MKQKNFLLIQFIKVVSVTIIIFSILGLLGRYFWLFDLLVHFRQYYLIAGILLFISSIIVKNKWSVIGSLIIIGINAYFIVNVYIEPKIPVDDKAVITFVVLNVNHDAVPATKLTELLNEHTVDIAVFAETSTTRVLEVQGLLGDEYVSEFAARDGSRSFGVGVIAKKTLDTKLSIVDPADNGIASISGIFNKDSKLCSFEGIHTMYPFGYARTKARNDQLFAVAENVKSESCVIVLGDMNITPWSPVFSEVLERGNLSDSRVGFGVHASWPEWLPYFFRIPIDHALVGKDVNVIERKILSPIGSDHFPVLIKVVI